VKILAEYKLAVGLSRIFHTLFSKDWELAGPHPTTKQRGTATLTVAKRPTREVADAVLAFLRERLDFYLREVLGFKYDEVNAVLAADADNVADACARADALRTLRGHADFLAICAAFTRIKGILAQALERKFRVGSAFSYDYEALHEEKHLAAHAERTAEFFRTLRANKEYTNALIHLSALRPHVDAFFDKVMVLVEDEKVRANRLALLQKLMDDFSTIADFSEIVTEGTS
jgi:glycyl-tRNA synthetase beta chain